MEDSILNFAEQFSFEPEIINGDDLHDNYESYILGGMGGSHLSGDVLKAYKPNLNLYSHKDYGVPVCHSDPQKNPLFIASSYSGNTEEVLDFMDEAYSKGFDVVAISTGGKLLEIARKEKIPFIKIPDTGIQPRSAIGFSTIALAYIVLPEALSKLHELSSKLKPKDIQKDGEELGKCLSKKIPIVYASNNNKALALNWKIKFNETGKIPSFYNLIPELNHNEMQGYDFSEINKGLSENFHFIIIADRDDTQRIIKRMEVTEDILESKGLPVTTIFLEGETRLEMIFRSIILADWTALELSKIYNTDPIAVPLIEGFKKKLDR